MEEGAESGDPAEEEEGEGGAKEERRINEGRDGRGPRGHKEEFTQKRKWKKRI